MAKLKIPVNKNDGTVNHNLPNVQGYVNVVDNIILNEIGYYDLLLADDTERADMLQTSAGLDENGRTCVIYQEAKNGDKEPINSNNCVIKGERDRRKKTAGGNKSSKYTMPFAEPRPTDVNYLDKYAWEIFTLYCRGYNMNPPAVGTAPTDNTKLERAHKFMFGMMLLTRCR